MLEHKRLHALDHVKSVELKQYLENLCQDLRGILPGEDAERDLVVEGMALEVPTAMGIPLGYIVSELATNSGKYAHGKITVRLGTNPKGYQLSVSDDGPGFPKGFDPKKSKGLGMKIVSSLRRVAIDKSRLWRLQSWTQGSDGKLHSQ
jgi:two-component system, sensor histidine kinase PdtaS